MFLNCTYFLESIAGHPLLLSGLDNKLSKPSREDKSKSILVSFRCNIKMTENLDVCNVRDRDQST